MTPLDGTATFDQGSPDYAVMAALGVPGVAVLSVIPQRRWA
ncbi:hypothetical protein IV498_17170 [Paenarthrobacter sp. Z7-10]|nr:hypothetical protein [Paenarthrobacter sp. Z7-10]